MNIKKIYLELLTLVSPKLNTKVFYKRRMGKNIDLDNPKTFNEKVQWLKLNVYPKEQIYSDCADKYLVREYVKKCGLEETLNELIGVYDNANQINWAELPNQFVLKWNFGCGLNIICSDKNKLDEKEVKKKLNRWRNNKFYLRTSEMHYKKISKKIICEKYLADETTKSIDDYKFYCFDGKADCVMVCVGRDKGKPKFYYFDRNWKFLREYSKDGIDAPKNLKIPKPKDIEKMFKYADVLSKGFPFVRVDFYYTNNKIVFGELTFTPSAGLDVDKVKNIDILHGQMIKLPMRGDD